jgi:hypothetical protein
LKASYRGRTGEVTAHPAKRNAAPVRIPIHDLLRHSRAGPFLLGFFSGLF